MNPLYRWKISLARGRPLGDALEKLSVGNPKRCLEVPRNVVDVRKHLPYLDPATLFRDVRNLVQNVKKLATRRAAHYDMTSGSRFRLFLYLTLNLIP
jgi:hypothetical protein